MPGLKAKAGASVTAQVTFNSAPGGPRTWRAAAIELDTATGAIDAHPVAVTGGASDGVSLHFWVGTIVRN